MLDINLAADSDDASVRNAILLLQSDIIKMQHAALVDTSLKIHMCIIKVVNLDIISTRCNLHAVAAACIAELQLSLHLAADIIIITRHTQQTTDIAPQRFNLAFDIPSDKVKVHISTEQAIVDLIITIRLLKGGIELIRLATIACQRTLQLRQSLSVNQNLLTVDIAIEERLRQRTAQMSLGIYLALKVHSLILNRQMCQIKTSGLHRKIQLLILRHNAIQQQAAIKGVNYKMLQLQVTIIINITTCYLRKQLLRCAAVRRLHLAINMRMLKRTFNIHNIRQIAGQHILLADKCHQRLNAYAVRFQRYVYHRLCAANINRAVQDMIALLHIGTHILKFQHIIFQANKAMCFIYLLRHKLNLLQLNHAGKFWCLQRTADNKACRAQTAALLPCGNIQHRVNRKVSHTSTDSKLALRTNRAFRC